MGFKTADHLGNAFFVPEFLVKFEQGRETIGNGIVSDSYFEDDALDEVKDVLFSDCHVFLSE